MKCLRRKFCLIRSRTWMRWWNNGRASNGEACGGVAREVTGMVRGRRTAPLNTKGCGTHGQTKSLCGEWARLYHRSAAANVTKGKRAAKGGPPAVGGTMGGI